MDNVAFMKGLYEAFGRGDIPTVLAAMSPDFQWYPAEGNPYRPAGGSFAGPDAVLGGLFMKLGAEWDGFTIRLGRIHDAGETVVMEVRYTGTYKPTGRSVDMQACHIWTIRGGKLVRHHQYADTAQLQRAMS